MLTANSFVALQLVHAVEPMTEVLLGVRVPLSCDYDIARRDFIVMWGQEQHHERLHVSGEMVENMRLDLDTKAMMRLSESRLARVSTSRKLLAYRIANQVRSAGVS